MVDRNEPWSAVVYERAGKTEVGGWCTPTSIVRRVAKVVKRLPGPRPMCIVVVKEVRRG